MICQFLHIIFITNLQEHQPIHIEPRTCTQAKYIIQSLIQQLKEQSLYTSDSDSTLFPWPYSHQEAILNVTSYHNSLFLHRLRSRFPHIFQSWECFLTIFEFLKKEKKKVRPFKECLQWYRMAFLCIFVNFSLSNSFSLLPLPLSFPPSSAFSLSPIARCVFLSYN